MSTPVSDKILFLMKLILIPSVLLFVALILLWENNSKDKKSDNSQSEKNI